MLHAFRAQPILEQSVARAAPAPIERFFFIRNRSGGMSMTKIAAWPMVVVALGLAVLGGKAISAQDKYTVQVPNGLAFSEFRGYEDWQVVAVSKTDELMVRSSPIP
jgi:hypothetical protein